MYHLRLCKGLSYSGAVTATKQNPDVFVHDKETAEKAVATGYFKLMGITGDTDESNGDTGGISNKPLTDMSVGELKELSAKMGADIKGLSRKSDIIARIKETAAAEDKPSCDDDITSQFIDNGDSESSA